MEDIADKKRAIFESMLDLIKDHGFHGAPMSLVAKNAGVAAGTIYHYFESKDQLILELHAYNKSRIGKVVHEALQEQLRYKEIFMRVWSNIFEFYIKNTNVLIFFEQYINSPYNTNRCPNQFEGELFNFFKKGVENGELKNLKPEVLMILMLGSINSVAKIHQFANIPINKTDLEQIVHILWEGMSKK